MHAPSEPLLHKRYRLTRELGRGSAGVVYSAEDVALDRRVALKMLHSGEAERVSQLKNEFRSLAALSHPNLVELHDLVASGGRWFFTMELIDGRGFVEALRDPATGKPDFAGVRSALRQIVAALESLHGSRKLHRDIKPTNVLVEPTGRVVLVDFGMVTEHGTRQLRSAEGAVFAGTLAYMAPEQIWGQASPASDWYGLGAMLYEVLTGTVPLDRRGLRSVMAGMPPTIRPPRELAPDTPEDLEAVVDGLLRMRAEERFGPAEILSRLASSPTVVPLGVRARTREAEGRLIGRDPELATLADAFASGRPGLRLVVVDGPSGIGKTALVERFLADVQAAEPDGVVLRAQCHPRESLPFQAVDGLIDDLTRFLDRRPAAARAALLPPDSAMIALLFPVFGRVCPATAVPSGEPHEIRGRAFAALRELMVRVADTHATVVWIDDLQWGDLDSAALLRELVRPPHPPGLMLVTSYRADSETAPELIRELAHPLEAVSDGTTVRWLHLAALSAHDAHELALQLLADGGDPAAVATESGGNPLIVGELARYHAEQGARPRPSVGPLGFADVIAARIEGLPGPTRRVLDLVSIGGEPMIERLLYRLVQPTAAVAGGVRELRRLCLLRTAGSDGEVALETFHHRIGETVSALLAPEERRILHREIAQALEVLPDANPQLLVEHYLHAGDLSRAGEHAYVSAEKAVATLAFHSAARLYRQALQLGTSACSRWRLNVKLGDALISAGRSGEGAACLSAAAVELAADQPASVEVLRIKRRAAEYYLRGGQHAEGLVALREILVDARLRYAGSPTTALLSLLGNRVRVGMWRRAHDRRPAAPLSAFERERLEVCWSAGVGLALFDQIRAADFQVRHAMLAHRAGDRDHIARALATEGLILAWEGGSRKRQRGKRFSDAGERLSQETGDPNIRAHSTLMRAASAYYDFRLRDALDLCAEGERLCREECVGAMWELANLQVLKGNTLACLGELPRLRAHLPETLRQARERDDRYCLVIARLGYNNMVWLAADRPDEARRQADDALAGPFPKSFAWQLYQGVLALAQIELYVGDGRAGWDRMCQAWSELRRKMMLRFQATRVEVRHLWARCALQRAAEETGAARRRLIGFAARSARRIAAEDATWVAPFADVLGAGVATLGGARDAAIRGLSAAALGFERLDMTLHASAVRYQIGMLGGGGGAAQVAREAALMQALGVANPARMAQVVAPLIV